jgi:radical SAM superfamily enzyme YgiQ (UPF0313 family)
MAGADFLICPILIGNQIVAPFGPMQNGNGVPEGMPQKPEQRFTSPSGRRGKLRLIDFEFLNEMRATGFRKLHLALETIDNDTARSWNRKQAIIEAFEQAVEVARKAGWIIGNQDLNAFVLFGIPDEDIQTAINTALYASQKIGSVIPMLFTPVPGSPPFNKHQDDLFSQTTQDSRKWDLQDLNGRLLPFLKYNRQKHQWLKARDYLNLESLMMHPNNSKLGRCPFNFASEGTIARSFRSVLVDAVTQ